MLFAARRAPLQHPTITTDVLANGEVNEIRSQPICYFLSNLFTIRIIRPILTLRFHTTSDRKKAP